MSGPPADVVARAETFVWAEAGFAQVTTLDDHGYPVCRSMTAFLADGFVVELVQRRVHRRLVQLAANPRLLVTWVGTGIPRLFGWFGSRLQSGQVGTYAWVLLIGVIAVLGAFTLR